MWNNKKHFAPVVKGCLIKDFIVVHKELLSIVPLCRIPWRHGNGTSWFDVWLWFLLLNNIYCSTINILSAENFQDTQMISPEACTSNQGIHTHTHTKHTNLRHRTTHTHKFIPRSQYSLRHGAPHRYLWPAEMFWPKRSSQYRTTEPLLVALRWHDAQQFGQQHSQQWVRQRHARQLMLFCCQSYVYWNEMAYGYIFSGSEKRDWHGFYSRITSSICHHSNDAIWMK